MTAELLFLCLQRIKKLVVPTDEWGPALNENREVYYDSIKAEGKGEVTAEMMVHLHRRMSLPTNKIQLHSKV